MAKGERRRLEINGKRRLQDVKEQKKMRKDKKVMRSACVCVCARSCLSVAILPWNIFRRRCCSGPTKHHTQKINQYHIKTFLSSLFSLGFLFLRLRRLFHRLVSRLGERKLDCHDNSSYNFHGTKRHLLSSGVSIFCHFFPF